MVKTKIILQGGIKMSTMTAQLLIGNAHPNDGGINPEFYMYLSENGVARWTIIKENIFSESINNEDDRVAQWIPTIEHMLEDALIMTIVSCV
jgi:hypothetical protein